MAFGCPACGAPIDGSPAAWLRRCPGCKAWLRSRAAETGTDVIAYDVEAAGRPSTRRRVEAPWTAADQRRLRSWLAWSTVLTLGLVIVLLALAALR
jgi:hypothetical protein